MTDQPYILQYSYPDFGSVSVPLYKESKEVIDFLEKAEVEGIRHFEKLDHLGRIRDAHKSAHHSRWEYMFLQMYLFHELKERGGVFGLSTKIRLSNKFTVSSCEELLKCWALLLNFGHLRGTFENERAWFEILIEDKQLREAFCEYLPDRECIKAAKEVFDSENYYKFHILLSLLFLNQLKTKPEFSEHPMDKFTLMVKRYLLDSARSRSIERSKNIFRRVRKIAYLLLDCTFSSTFVKINPKIFFDYIVNNSNEVVYEEDSNFQKTLESISIHLFEELYASKQASILKFNYLSQKKVALKNEINKDRKTYLEHLPEELYASKRSDISIASATEKQHILRLSFLPREEYFERSSCKYYTEQKYLTKRLKLANIFPLATPEPSDNGSLLDIFSESPTRTSGLPVFVWSLLKYADDLYSEWAFEDYIYQRCIENPVQDLFMLMLNLISQNSQFKARLQEASSPDDYNVNLLVGKNNFKAWIKRITRDMRDSSLTNDRKKEIECLKAMVKEEKSGTLMISHCRVRFYDEKWKEKAEFDGVYFRVLRQALYLNVLESKSRMTARSTEAKKDLVKSLSTIGLKNVDQLIRTRSVKGKGVGYSYLKVNIKDILPPTLHFVPNH
ncbi:MAG: hypothetical protein DRG59_00925 [Deltaproteobacteria bacterium]|nr:MAG: hypothetical protein DRG59_00925 [Deltaproteobacteria bacterium]